MVGLFVCTPGQTSDVTNVGLAEVVPHDDGATNGIDALLAANAKHVEASIGLIEEGPTHRII